MAAILAGEGNGGIGRQTAVLSHRAAASLWRLLPPEPGPVDVSISGDGGRGLRKGIRLHRSRTLTSEMTTRHLRIPVTTPSRTISDLRRTASAWARSGGVSPWELRRAIRQADVLGLALGEEADLDRTRSDLERSFLRLCRKYGLRTPEVNVWIDSYEIDFHWGAHRLIVETDGYRYHRGRTAFEHDRSRDLRLRALGYEVIRLSYRQVNDDPQQVADVLRKLLERGE
jgi:very-short-patch-repair endonuclease